MKNSIRTRARKAISRAKLFFWEAQFLVGEKRIRKEAKREATRANRRLNKAIIKDEVEE